MAYSDDLALVLHAAHEDSKQVSASSDGKTLPCEKPRPVPIVTYIMEPTTPAYQPTTACRRHYVNLDPGDVHGTHKHRYGRYIALRAQVAWRDGTCTDSLAGQQVKWTFAARPSNLGGPPSYVTHKANESVGFSWYAFCVSTVTTSTDGDGWTEAVYFYPGNVGGNGYTITATSVENRASSVTTGAFDVWRRIPIRWDITRDFTSDTPGHNPPLAEANQHFAPGYIELVDAPDRNRFARSFTFQIHAYDFGMNHLEQPLQFRLTQNVHVEQGHARRLALHPARWRPMSGSAEYRPYQGVWTPLPPQCVTAVPLRHDTEGLLSLADPPPSDDYMDPDFYSTEQDLVLDANRVRITDWQIRQKLTIDLTSLNLNPSDDAPVDVKFRIRHAHYTSGDATSDPPMVAFSYLLRSMTVNAAREAAGVTVTHEIGHKLGFYPRGGPQYENNQGPHCTTPTCNMYWKWMAGARKQGFCAHCVGLLRQTDVRVLVLA
jgi:hypothetical protein